MAGEGKSVDLLKLFLVVKEKGGYETVSKNGLWDSVGEEIGLDCGLGCSLNHTYIKNIETLETVLQKVVQNNGLEGLFRDTSMIRDTSLMKLEQFREKGLDPLHSKLTNEDLFSSGGGDLCIKNGVNFSGESGNLTKTIDNRSVYVFSRKRKRECDQRMLNWVLEIAKDPSNTGVQPLPESSKWKSYGNEHIWKQVLLAREDMILKKDADISNTIWKAKHKMHPSMYDNLTGSESLRSSKRLLQVKRSQLLITENSISPPCFDSPSNTNCGSEYNFDKEFSSVYVDSALELFGKYEHRCVRVGPQYQATVPEYTEDTYIRDSKLLGSCVWPLEKGESYKPHQMKKTRKGGKVQDICKCRKSGSDQCIQHHVGMNRRRLKVELGALFDYWGFDKMGQQVSQNWTEEEEKTFQVIIESNPHSEGECFWDKMFTSFPMKSREELVSYYFNVFVLQRRGLQNRSIGKEIDSDGEESEYGPLSSGFGRIAIKSPASIFHSPKKAYLKSPIVVKKQA